LPNLAVVELGLREALYKDGCQALQQLLQDFIDRFDQGYELTRPGYACWGRSSLSVRTLFGTVVVRRDYYYNGQAGFYPADLALGLEGKLTPELARLMCYGGSQGAYEQASQDLQEYAGIAVEGRLIQRLVQTVGPTVEPWLAQEPVVLPAVVTPQFYVSYDGTGVPMRPVELRGRKGKQPDGSAKTREIKLGCVFTQHGVDAQGHPLRDPEATTYVASFLAAEDFGLLMRQEALRRGMAQAQQVIVLGDGALWIWEQARLNFVGALEILDFYHALEHVNALADLIYGEHNPITKATKSRWKKLLLKDRVGKIMAEAQDQLPQAIEVRKRSEGQIAYLATNSTRMQYGTYRKAGYFIGSGVIEAGCKTVIGMRAKQSGMKWSEAGARNVLNLRCLVASRRLKKFFGDRLKSKQSAVQFDCAMTLTE
jgi:hypothetical protein